MLHARDISGDWSFFTSVSGRLFGADRLEVYARTPSIQTGPISLVVVHLLASVGGSSLPIVVTFLALLTVASLSRLAQHAGVAWSNLLVGGTLLMVWWPALKTSGHLDDAMVLCLAALCLVAMYSDRRLGAAVLVGLAVAVKPWAIFLLPTTLDTPTWRKTDLRYPATSLLVAGMAWAPFIIADRRTLDGLRPTVWVAPDSILHVIGAVELSSSIRIVQLVLALAAVAIAVWRGHTAGALVVGVAVRLLLDGGTWPYYTVGLVLGAALWDVSRPGRQLPYLTLVTVALLPPAWLIQTHEIRAVMRLAACLVCLAVVVVWPEERRSHSSANDDDEQVSSTVEPVASVGTATATHSRRRSSGSQLWA
ncbi:MAG: hypothetical protein JWL72_2097 [Ilumatobacteraceae bacterium]|nr:hypothetical protein [Ilumatobacteraceae bacterium]